MSSSILFALPAVVSLPLRLLALMQMAGFPSSLNAQMKYTTCTCNFLVSTDVDRNRYHRGTHFLGEHISLTPGELKIDLPK